MAKGCPICAYLKTLVGFRIACIIVFLYKNDNLYRKEGIHGVRIPAVG